MYLPLNWLKEFIKFKETPEKVAEIFTLAGFEVEKIEYWGRDLAGVIVGEIKTIVSHAEADKLVVCKVEVGRKQLLNIVCGARNIKPGHKVPVALVGVKLPNGMKIERRRIRGVDSEGMLCAEDELGLGEDHSGIMILDKQAKVGQKLNKVLGLDDIVLDITVPANRVDCLSVIGLAKEFAAQTGEALNIKKTVLTENKKYNIKKIIKVKITDTDLCPKYTARVVKNVKVRPSPVWLQSRLRVCGIKSINNIVDATNYVMLERGQPLHAFDLANIAGKQIIVRAAGKDSKFATLDGEERLLGSQMLVIADAKQPIAVAGVMGGRNSEITRQTKEIVIESALFKPLSIRQTRQKLGIVTEASNRFEKGLWWDLPEWAADQAAQLISEVAGGEIVTGMINVSRQKENKPTVIKFNLKYLNRLIGRNFTLAEAIKSLEKLNCKIAKAGIDEIKVTVPSWRQDLNIPADLVEEVGRLYGWNNLKTTPVFAGLKPIQLPDALKFQEKIHNILAAAGLNEVYNYSFYSKRMIEQFGMQKAGHYLVQNPLNPEQEYMRTALLPWLQSNVLKNYQTREEIKIFEIGTVFPKSGTGLPNEKTMLGAIIYKKGKAEGKKSAHWEMMSVLNSVLSGVGFSEEEACYQDKDNGAVEIKIKGSKVGQYSWVLPESNKLGSPPVYFELDLQALLGLSKKLSTFRPISDYPAVTRDLTFTNISQADFAELSGLIRKASPLVKKVEAKDLYITGDSLTVRVIYQSSERTLTAKEIDILENEIIKNLSAAFDLRIKK
ncbi:MAG: phenylalanine--tRNA ligase subunit beta [Patescibacteria group bacterium]|jgi:phenylalanyl-tRNA synthetase beta chain